MARILEGELLARDGEFAIVVSRFNAIITDRLLDGALSAFRRHGVSDERITVAYVPGSFELPLAMLNRTNGFGPDNAGLTVITYLNEIAYRSGDLGLGSAVGWIVALMIMTFSFIQYRVSKVSDNE